MSEPIIQMTKLSNMYIMFAMYVQQYAGVNRAKQTKVLLTADTTEGVWDSGTVDDSIKTQKLSEFNFLFTTNNAKC